jgi:hypothetical protein
MEARTATRQDLSYVFAHLAARISQEFSAAGETEGGAKEHLLMDLREGRGHALREGDQILAVITWHEDDGNAYTSFAANEAFFAAKTVRFCKRHIQQIQQLCGNIPVRSVIWSNHPDVDRWFAAIGFNKVEANEKSTTYELPPREDKST